MTDSVEQSGPHDVHTTARLPYVLIVGGFSIPRAALFPLRWQLRAAGYESGIFVHRWGMDCSERTYERLHARLAGLKAHPGGVLALAYSRGGQFVKVLAVRQPKALRAVAAFGVPMLPGMDRLGDRTRRRIMAASRFGDAGLPGLVTSSCLNGGCCEEFWRDLARPWPKSVAVHSVYATHDTVVDGREYAGETVEPIWIPGGHRELVTATMSRQVAVEVVRALSTATGS